jgi:hypothetical protein
MTRVAPLQMSFVEIGKVLGRPRPPAARRTNSYPATGLPIAICRRGKPDRRLGRAVHRGGQGRPRGQCDATMVVVAFRHGPRAAELVDLRSCKTGEYSILALPEVTASHPNEVPVPSTIPTSVQVVAALIYGRAALGCVWGDDRSEMADTGA